MKTRSLAFTCVFVLSAVASAPAAQAAIVWGMGTGIGPLNPGTQYASFRFAAYVSHNSLTDDDVYDTMGVTAHIQVNSDYWNYFANAQVPVADGNVNQNIGNGISDVPIVDGYYAMQAWIHADQNDIGYKSVAATCYEYQQDCGP